MSQSKIFLTGGTGLIGTQLVRSLLNGGSIVYLLVRQESLTKAEELFKHHQNLRYIIGDLTDPYLIENPKEKVEIENECSAILHLGGLYDFSKGPGEHYHLNTVVTQRLLVWAKSWNKLKTFQFFSSFSVADESKQKIPEGPLKSYKSERSGYIRSKALIEQYLEQEDFPFQTIVYRPGIIISGTSKNAINTKGDGPGYFYGHLKRLQKVSPLLKGRNLTIPFPLSRDAKLPLVPVDILTSWVSAIINELKTQDFIPNSKPIYFNLIPENQQVTSEILNYLAQLSGISVNIKAIPSHTLSYLILKGLNIPTALGDFLHTSLDFEITNTRKYLGPHLSVRTCDWQKAILNEWESYK